MSYTIQRIAKELHLSENSVTKILASYVRVVRLFPDHGPRNTTIITEEMYSEIVATYSTAKRFGLSFLQLLLLKYDHRESLLSYFADTPSSSSQAVTPSAILQDSELEKLRASDELTQQKLDQLLARPSSVPDHQPFAEDIQQIKRNQEDLLRALRTKQSASPVPAPAPVTKE